MEMSRGARGEHDWRVPEPCKCRQGCGCHRAAPGDPQVLKGCTGRAGSSIATIPSPALALSPARSAGTNPGSRHPARVEHHVPAPQRLNRRHRWRQRCPTALRHVQPRCGGIPTRGAARWDRLRPCGSLRSWVSPSMSSVPPNSTGLSRTGLHCSEGLSFAELAWLLSSCWL